MKMIYHETMQIKVRIASTGPINIILIIFDAKKYNEHNLSSFRLKNITSSNILTHEYRSYLPVCECVKSLLGILKLSLKYT